MHTVRNTSRISIENARNWRKTNQNVVDRNVDDLHKESDESHDEKAHRCRIDNLFELCKREKGEERKRKGGTHKIAHTHAHTQIYRYKYGRF